TRSLQLQGKRLRPLRQPPGNGRGSGVPPRWHREAAQAKQNQAYSSSPFFGPGRLRRWRETLASGKRRVSKSLHPPHTLPAGLRKVPAVVFQIGVSRSSLASNGNASG